MVFGNIHRAPRFCGLLFAGTDCPPQAGTRYLTDNRAAALRSLYYTSSHVFKNKHALPKSFSL